MDSNFSIENNPSASELWAGIGGNFDSLSQIICEFVDNSISNFIGNQSPQRNINILINKESEQKIKVAIEDSGTGIKNLNKAFTLGSKECAESPYNEHGFGMKHALASANPKNDSWAIYTRTMEDANNGVFKKIESPYEIDKFKGKILPASSWPKYGQYGQSGTIVEFECDRDMFLSLSRGLKGGITNFDTLCDILYEDLGFIYSEILYKNEASIQLTLKNGDKTTSYRVSPIMPKWESDINPGEGIDEFDLGNGTVKINYHFGTIRDSGVKDDGHGNTINRTLFNNEITRKYYRRNMSSSGVELRFNGRLMCHNLFKEIWGIEKHNAYNDLLIVLNIVTDNLSALPETRTSKNGLREGDSKLDKLYEWIRGYLQEPKKNIAETDRETDIFSRLQEIKQKQYVDFSPLVVETEHFVFNKTGSNNDRERIDLFVNVENKITIYEGKKDKTTAKDVYQLRMYWDGLVYDGIHPAKAIIIAKSHSSGVRTLIEVINEMKDQSGRQYNFIAETWEDEGLDELK